MLCGKGCGVLVEGGELGRPWRRRIVGLRVRLGRGFFLRIGRDTFYISL
jgi:hypothetical protein